MEYYEILWNQENVEGGQFKFRNTRGLDDAELQELMDNLNGTNIRKGLSFDGGNVEFLRYCGTLLHLCSSPIQHVLQVEQNQLLKNGEKNSCHNSNKPLHAEKSSSPILKRKSVNSPKVISPFKLTSIFFLRGL